MQRPRERGLAGFIFVAVSVNLKQPSRQIAKASLSRKPRGLICLVLLSESGRRSIQSLINETEKCHPLF